MKVTPLQNADTRTPAQIEADLAAERGDWDGFETEELLTEEGARLLLDHASKLTREIERNPAAASVGLLGQPFRWKSKVYRLLRCEYLDGEAKVAAEPNDADFCEEVKKRIERDRSHTLSYHQGFGFACFPEDYRNYQDGH